MHEKLACAAGLGVFAVCAVARADATVTVGDARFAQPPPRVVVVPDAPIAEPPEAPRDEPYRSPFRLAVGPAAFFSGADGGAGLGVAADFGTGTVGARLYAAWMRAQKQGTPDEASSATGAGFGQYTGEVTLDFHKRGPLHPVFGLGGGVLHVFRPGGDLVAGIGTARLTLEYALAFDDADVRLGAGILGALPGPAPRALSDLKGYGVVGGTLSVGF